MATNRPSRPPTIWRSRFRPDRYEAERDRLEALGLKPRLMQFPDMSAHALFFHDPEGNVLELICHNAGE